MQTIIIWLCWVVKAAFNASPNHKSYFRLIILSVYKGLLPLVAHFKQE